MTHHITDEQIAKLHDSMFPAPYDGHANVVRFARAVLALAAPQVEPYGWAVTGCHSLYRGEWAESTAQAEAKRCGGTAVAFPLYTAAPSVQPEQAEAVEPVAYRIDYPGVTDIIGLRRFCGADEYQSFRPTIEFLGGVFVPLYTQSPTAVPEDVAWEPMTRKWCWWIGDDETFHVADTEAEAHGEAQCRIDDDCMPGYQREYSVARVQHPIDSLGMDWLAEHVADTIEEDVCCWCDDNSGAEDPSITLAAEDRKVLGTMVAAFLREKVSVHWWTADQKTITKHTHIAQPEDADAMLSASPAAASQEGGE